jgi:NADPH:quinone reductase-like Zn-dependent oxidoreductase
VPAVGGYEGVGEVQSVGSAVKGLSPGDLVIPSPPSFGIFIVCSTSPFLEFLVGK